MKKKYQIPETLICEMELSNFMVEDSGEIGAGGNLTNENETFEDDIETTSTSSSLWD